MDYKFPEDLKYTTSHEWVKIEADIAIVGITDYAQYQLGDIVYVELPEKGTNLEKGKSSGEIESVKAVGELIMPLSGEILEINENLVDSPELVNSSPYENGWFLKIKISDSEEIKELLSVDKYRDFIKSEEE